MIGLTSRNNKRVWVRASQIDEVSTDSEGYTVLAVRSSALVLKVRESDTAVVKLIEEAS